MDLDRPPDIVVVAGGEPVAPSLVPDLRPTTLVVAADAGVDRARALGWRVDVAVGDFDSVSAAGRAALEDEIADVRTHPADKDATDLELALQVADELASTRPDAPSRVLVLGLEGGRPDHALANLLVAASDRHAALDIELVLAQGRAWVVRCELVGRCPAGRTLSLVPVHGPATVSTSGLRWPLQRSTLEAGTTRGVSNESAGGPLTITVHDGTVLCIAPRTQEIP